VKNNKLKGGQAYTSTLQGTEQGKVKQKRGRLQFKERSISYLVRATRGGTSYRKGYGKRDKGPH